MNDNEIARLTMESPIGRLVVEASERGLARIELVRSGHPPANVDGPASSAKHLRLAARALRRYFDGDPGEVSDVVLAPQGTPFQRAVWAALQTIPHGTTISYRDLAERINRPNAVRAVGLANGQNPVPIIVPCHRVIGANGMLTGFGLGLSVKAWLLVHEGAAQAFPRTVTRTTRLERTDQLSLLDRR